MISFGLLVLLIVCLVQCHGFVVRSTQSKPLHPSSDGALLLLSSFHSSAANQKKAVVRLSMAGEKKDQDTDEEEIVDEITVTGEDEEEAAAAEEEDDDKEKEPEEDPELKALKEEIAALETQVKEKRRQANDVSDRAEEYTKTGYARKVAEMENMRRARSMLNSSSRSSATASILTEFLPILDRLMYLREKYAADEYGKQYDALPGALKAVFTEMGVKDYETKAGEPIDKYRMEVIESEHSDEQPANTVLRPVSIGLELQGNPIRLAKCVASLGPEKAAKEEASAEEQSSSESGEAPDEE